MTFAYQIETDVDRVNFQDVAEVLHSAGLAKETDVPNTEKTFRNSDVTIFIKDGSRVIGVGRALLLEKLKGTNIILYTHPQTLTLYEKYGFRRNKTAFSHFSHGSEEGLKWMEDEGFFLPEGYRFESEIGRY